VDSKERNRKRGSNSELDHCTAMSNATIKEALEFRAIKRRDFFAIAVQSSVAGIQESGVSPVVHSSVLDCYRNNRFHSWLGQEAEAEAMDEEVTGDEARDANAKHSDYLLAFWLWRLLGCLLALVPGV